MSGNLKTAIIHGVEPSSTGTVNYTVAGFGTPVAALMIGSFCSSLDSLNRHSVLSYGFTDGLLSRCSYFTARDGDANTHSRGGSQDTLFCRVSSYGVDPQAVANFNSWITDGIQLNWSTVPSDTKMQFVIILIGGTGVAAKVGDFTPSSSVDGTVDVTDLGIDPEILFFTGSRNNFSPTFQGTEHASISLGLATSSAGLVKNACVYCSEAHYTSPSDTQNGFFNNRCHRLYNDATNVIDFSLELTSVGTGQFTVTTRDYNTNIYEVAYLALNLNGDAFDIQFQSLPDSIGNQDWPSGGGLSFSPENLFAIASWNTTANADEDIDYNVMFGAANSTNDTAIVITGRDGQSGGNEAGWVSDDYCFVITSADGSIYKRGSVGSWGADRVTINFISVSGSRLTQAAILLIGAGALTILPNGIASAEAFGSLTIEPGNVNVAPNGIASAEAFGIPSVILNQFVTPDSILSGEAFGTPAILNDQEVSPIGIPSSELFGLIQIDLQIKYAGAIASQESWGLPWIYRGSVNIQVNSIESAEAVGSPTVAPGSVSIALSSIPSGEAFGLLSIGLEVLPSSIGSDESFGFPMVVAGGVLVSPDSITTEEAFGTPSLLVGNVNISPSGIVSEESFGFITVIRGSTEILADSIISAESWGLPTIVPETAFVNPNGIISGEDFGSPSLSVGYVDISPNGITSAEGFGSPYVTVSGVQVSPYSISSSEALGSPTILPGGVVITLQGIESGASFGIPTILPGTVFIAPDGIVSAETFGSVNIGLSIQVDTIVSDESFGSPSISVGNVNVVPNGIVSEEAFGNPIVRHVLIIVMDGAGIASSEGFGSPTISLILRNAFQTLMESDLENGFFNLNEFAEMVVYIHKDGTTIQLPVIFDHEMQLIDADAGAEVLSRHPIMQAQTSAFSILPDKGDKVVIRGVRYQVISYEPDGTGVASFRLHHERTV